MSYLHLGLEQFLQHLSIAGAHIVEIFTDANSSVVLYMQMNLFLSQMC